MTGCKPLEEVAEVAADNSPAEKAAPAAQVVHPEPATQTQAITPELVASWQAQTGFNSRSNLVIDQVAPKAAPVQIDWAGVANTCKEFFSFCGDVKSSVAKGVKNTLVVACRGTLFLTVLTFCAWFLVTGVSAHTHTELDADSRSQLAAQTVVFDFLQNARLNQYDRARRLLAPGARRSVSTGQLQMMINSLPLNHEPTDWKTELSTDRTQARVVIARDGLNEVYTLVQSDTGWGLASVSVANS